MFTPTIFTVSHGKDTVRVETFYKFYGATLIAQYEHNVGNTIYAGNH